MTSIYDNEKNFIEYLALVDNVHDFMEERCDNDDIKERLNDIIRYWELEPDDDVKLKIKKTTGNYKIDEKNYVEKVLKKYNITVGQTTSKNQYNIFKQIFGITSNMKYYTNHDAMMSIKPKWPKKDKNHIVLKTPQNNFDSATSGGTSGSLGNAKVELVFPDNLSNIKGWKFESNILSRGEYKITYDKAKLTPPKNVLLSMFKKFKSRKGVFKITTFSSYRERVDDILSVPFSVGGPIEYIKNKLNKMVKLKKAQLETGISVGSLCKSLSEEPDVIKTVGDKIQKQLYELNGLEDDDDLYDIILDIKRSGDWEQVLSTKWYQKRNKNKKVIFITGDYLCFLYAILNDINVAFISRTQMMTYNKGTQRGGAPKRPREENDDYDGPDTKKRKEEVETDEQEITEKSDIVDGFIELISNIRDLTMLWHSDTISGKLDEDYQDIIVNLIKIFNDEIKTNVYSGMDITIANVKAVISEISDVLLNKETAKQNVGVVEGKIGVNQEGSNSKKNIKVYLMCISILFEIQSYVFDDNYDMPSENEKFTDINTKPALPHIIESFYYPIITNKIYGQTNELELSHKDSARIIKQLLNNLYDSIVLSLEGGEERTSNIFANGGFDTAKSKEINLKNFFTSLKEILRKEEENNNGNPDFVDKLNSSKESYIESAKIFIDTDIKYQLPIKNDDYSMDVDIDEEKKQQSEEKYQENKMKEPSTTVKAPKQKHFEQKMEIDNDDSLNKVKKKLFVNEQSEGKVSSGPPLKTFTNSNNSLSEQSIVSVTGGKRKRNNKKTKKRTKKLKKTKKKAQKNKKTSLPKSKKKTKKVKKKRRNKTKIKKGGNKKKYKKKRKKKKQLFEMSIKELKDYVKNRK